MINLRRKSQSIVVYNRAHSDSKLYKCVKNFDKRCEIELCIHMYATVWQDFLEAYYLDRQNRHIWLHL